MAYSEDYRKRVVQYIEAGHTQRETCATFGISFAALNDWLKKYRDTGEIKDKRPARQPKKLDPEKLKKYVEEHPDACLQEIGDAFGCTDTAVWKAFKRLGITRKKRQRGIGSRKQKQ